MNATDKQLRALLAQQASEWFVLNDAESLTPRQSSELVGWLTRSPDHVAEFLAVAEMARDLRAVRLDDPALHALVERARADAGDSIHELEFGPRGSNATERAPARRLLAAAAAAAIIAAIGAGLWHMRIQDVRTIPTAAEARLHTGRDERWTLQLADHSVLHLNSDTTLTLRYTAQGRFVRLEAGQAAFEVAHESQRGFHVVAGAAEVSDLGTSFDVRLAGQSTVVTVIEGVVEVHPTDAGTALHLEANQQVTVASGQSLNPVSVDAHRETAWLRRQIEFDHEPLERVAAEFNRYAAKPVLITTVELRALPVSGVFSIDDTEELIAFLRSLDGVRVEVTARDIRVSKK